MLKYLKRFYYRYSYPVNVLGCTGIFLFIFYKPLYFMYFTTQTEEYLKGILEFVLVKSLEKSNIFIIKLDPKRLKLIEEQNERKEQILKLVEQIKNCQDPEEKKQLKESLNKIHIARYRRLQDLPINRSQ